MFEGDVGRRPQEVKHRMMRLCELPLELNPRKWQVVRRGDFRKEIYRIVRDKKSLDWQWKVRTMFQMDKASVADL